MSRAALVLMLSVALGCGPSASPEKPRPVATIVPYQVTLVAGTDAARVDELAANGAVPVARPHLDGDRYVVRMTEATAAEVRGLAWVAGAEPLAPEQRYARDRFADGGGPVPVIIDVFEDADTGAVVAALRAWGGEPVETAPHTVRATLEPGRVAELAAMPQVRWIEPR